MKFNLKYTMLSAVAALGLGSSVWAQRPVEGEIIMTEQELESFLSTIARHKKEQIKNRKEKEIIRLHSLRPATQHHEWQPHNKDNASVIRELDRINHRLDLLIMQSGRADDARLNPQPAAPATTRVNTHVGTPAPASQYEGDYSAINRRYTGQVVAGSVPVPVSPATPTPQYDAETEALISERNKLNEELQILSALHVAGSATDYSAEIEALKSKIEQMSEALERNKATNTLVERRTIVEVDNRASALAKQYSGFMQVIYFDNNSSSLSQADKAGLQQLAETVKANHPHMTVVVRGFASKKGNAQYNNTLSFNRAEAVKQALLGMGLNAGHIVTLYHGVDNAKDEAQARRVEITLSVQ